MKNLLDKLSRAVDAFADVMTEDVVSVHNVKLYKYEDFKKYFLDIRKENAEVKRAKIYIEKVDEFDGNVFPEKQYLIRIIFINKLDEPVMFENKPNEYMGTVIVASAIDKDLLKFMDGKTERTVG